MDNHTNQDLVAIAREYEEKIPLGHECPNDDTCPHPAGITITYIAMDENGTGNVNAAVHGMDTGELIQVLVSVIDQIAQDDVDLPPLDRFARARNYLRHVAENADPPASVTNGLSIADIVKGLRPEGDES